MTSLRKLSQYPQARCATLCRNVDTGNIERCARWKDHEPTSAHSSYKEVIEDMAQAFIIAAGGDTTSMDDMAILVYMKRAQAWYRQIVIDTINEEEGRWHKP